MKVMPLAFHTLLPMSTQLELRKAAAIESAVDPACSKMRSLALDRVVLRAQTIYPHFFNDGLTKKEESK